eukprot:Skav223726  [mRNA]  locus=scaffold205:47275:47731:- [translate_table: standard]
MICRKVSVFITGCLCHSGNQSPVSFRNGTMGSSNGGRSWSSTRRTTNMDVANFPAHLVQPLPFCRVPREDQKCTASVSPFWLMISVEESLEAK